MGIGKEIMGEVKELGPSVVKTSLDIVLPHLKSVTDETVLVLTRIDKATGDWEKDGTLGKIEPKDREALSKQLKAIQANLDKITTMAEIFQREVLPRFKGGK